MKIAYKFITDQMKSKNGNVKWKIGKWNKHEGELNLCESGFHACFNPVHALNYNYGNVFCIVEQKGNICVGSNKFACSEMRVIKIIPIKAIVDFAKTCAIHCQKYNKNKYAANAADAADAANAAAHAAYANAADASYADAAAHAAYAAYAAYADANTDAERKWQEKKFKEIIAKAVKK